MTLLFLRNEECIGYWTRKRLALLYCWFYKLKNVRVYWTTTILQCHANIIQVPAPPSPPRHSLAQVTLLLTWVDWHRWREQQHLNSCNIKEGRKAFRGRQGRISDATEENKGRCKEPSGLYTYMHVPVLSWMKCFCLFALLSPYRDD